jgi:hypothetical protein
MGRLFFIPEGYVTGRVEVELMANGKLLAVDLFTGDMGHQSHIDRRLFVPYATPIGFNTKVLPETEDAWQRISDLVRRYGGGPMQ